MGGAGQGTTGYGAGGAGPLADETPLAADFFWMPGGAGLVKYPLTLPADLRAGAGNVFSTAGGLAGDGQLESLGLGMGAIDAALSSAEGNKSTGNNAPGNNGGRLGSGTLLPSIDGSKAQKMGNQSQNHCQDQDALELAVLALRANQRSPAPSKTLPLRLKKAAQSRAVDALLGDRAEQQASKGSLPALGAVQGSGSLTSLRSSEQKHDGWRYLPAPCTVPLITGDVHSSHRDRGGDGHIVSPRSPDFLREHGTAVHSMGNRPAVPSTSQLTRRGSIAAATAADTGAREHARGGRGKADR